MAKGAKIKDEVRRLIAGVYLEHSEWRAKEIQKEVNIRLRRQNPRVQSNWPGLSAIQKELVKLRGKLAQAPDPRDAQWSVGCLAQYDVPPEALPVVLSIYEERLRTEEYSFTIREALWIGRLYKVIDDPIFLERFASAYALRDKIDWILDNPVYTRGFDFKLLNYSNPDERAKVIASITQFPGYFNPFPGHTNEEQEEVREKLKQKGYDIETPGMAVLRKHVAELKKQALEVTQLTRAQLEQKKPEELIEEEARYLKWAQKWLNSKGGKE